MDKLTITKLEKPIYRFLDICKMIINKHDDNYFFFYDGETLDFLHPYASCRIMIKDEILDLFEGVEHGVFSLRQTPTGVYELLKVADHVPAGIKYIDFEEIIKNLKFGCSIKKSDHFKASLISDRTSILFRDEDIKILNKFQDLTAYYIEGSNTLYFFNEEEFGTGIYQTEIVINPQNDLLLNYQLEFGEVYGNED